MLEWEQARGHLVIVVDDVGRELQHFEALLGLRFPLTFAVVPGGVYAAGVQQRLLQDRRRPRDILLHLPMEPEGDEHRATPAERREDFLQVTDSPEVLRIKVERALERVPAAIGVNNHMGSRFTRDRDALGVVFDVLARHRLGFLDSRTTADSQAHALAVDRGIALGVRHVFLDADPAERAVRDALLAAAETSQERPTVAIVHPGAAVVRVLRDELPRLHARGIGVFSLSELVARSRTAHLGQAPRPGGSSGERTAPSGALDRG
jgi:hypothetical protein